MNAKEKLQKAFPGAHIEIVDESSEHIGHGASGAHYAVSIVYSGFEGKSRIEQHQMVYAALADEMKGDIHALKIMTRVK
jgi:BolA family transcriptional regulator, general stress-responsive regulator